MSDNLTIQLLQIIGSPFAAPLTSFNFPDDHLKRLFKLAFENRVELLFLEALARLNKLRGLENEYARLKDRHKITLSVIADAAKTLNSADIPYVVFKSIKPFPSTPNDTDILCMGDKSDYKRAYETFMNNGYREHETAPLQINIYHPRGEGKIGPGKKGGTYYIDFYHEVSADYFVYVNKKKLIPFIREVKHEGIKVKTIAPEIELAIVMYHNVFPEKTFHLEHFYLPLYHFSAPSFDIDVFCRFVEDNHLKVAVKANLSIIEILHKSAFGFFPAPVFILLEKWGREKSEIRKLHKSGIEIPYSFTPSIFWKAFFFKLGDIRSVRSIFNQSFHMFNPKFFADVVRIVFRRTFGYEKYKHDW